MNPVFVFITRAMNFQEQLESYSEKRKKGMDFSQIRKELNDLGADENQVKEIIREIERREVAGELSSKKKLQAKDLRLIGWTLMLIGGFASFGSHFKLFDLGKYTYLAFIPVVIGYLLIVSARRAQKRGQ